VRTIIAIGCLLFAGISIKAQSQHSLYGLFDIYKSYYNPAFTAYDGNSSIYAVGSHHYTHPLLFKFPHPFNPVAHHFNSSTIGASAPIFIKGKQKFGIGLIYTRQSHLYEKANDLRLTLAFHQKTGRGKLMLGINLDRINYQLDFYNEQGSIWNFPLYKAKWLTYDGGVGVAYHSSPTNFYLGIAYNYVTDRKLDIDYRTSYEIYSVGFISSGIDINLGKRLKIKPSVLIKKYTFTSASGNLVAEYNDKFIAGLTFGSYETYGIRMGYRLRSLSIHYAYNNFYTTLTNFSIGSNSLGLTYTFAQKTPFKVYDFGRILPAGK
jgi:type IX secretion system PorP/SprF family membrane protein